MRQILGSWVTACAAAFFVAVSIIPAVLNAAPGSDTGGTNAAADDQRLWFTRAIDQLNIRAAGASPFQLEVKFHAFPGDEALSTGQVAEIVTGDGEYRETWLGPHSWKREVQLDSYHAVETESDRGRKWTASSGVEPSRVHMLLRELFHPLSDPAKWKSDSQWKVERISNGDATLVRFSNSGGDGVAISTAYYFTTRGLFVTRNHVGLMAQWSGHAVFAGHIVAKHLVISAGERKLLEADVTVTEASTTNISGLDQAGSPASPSQTLMPLEFVATPPKPLSDSPGWLGFGAAALSYWGVVDRTGRVHELEVIQSVGDAETHNFLKDLRRARFGPARIEGEPCEVGLVGVIGRSIH